MKAEAKAKPIRELLLDITHTMNTSSDSPRGVINPKLVNHICFGASVLAVLLSAITIIAMIWDYVEPGRGLKYIGSIAVVLFTLLTLRAVNGAFLD